MATQPVPRREGGTWGSARPLASGPAGPCFFLFLSTILMFLLGIALARQILSPLLLLSPMLPPLAPSPLLRLYPLPLPLLRYSSLF
jgi:hypothetical protein